MLKACCGLYVERKMPFGRLRGGWEDNIKMDLKGIGWDVVDWINLAQGRKWVRVVMKFWVP
jgi:hypothetical protein